MTLNVKKAKLADAPALAEVLTEAMRYKFSLGDKAWGDHPYSVEELQKRINKGTTYSAWIDNQIVGTLMLIWEDEMMWGKQPPVAAYVHQLAVKDGYHGQDIGKKMLDWAAEEAAKQGRKLLRLDFPPNNPRLKAYYEKLDFKFVMNREIHKPDITYTASLYEKPV